MVTFSLPSRSLLVKLPNRGINSEFTQQEGRKKKTAKRLSVTNVTGILLACFGIHLILLFLALLQKDLFKGM